MYIELTVHQFMSEVKNQVYLENLVSVCLKTLSAISSEMTWWIKEKSFSIQKKTPKNNDQVVNPGVFQAESFRFKIPGDSAFFPFTFFSPSKFFFQFLIFFYFGFK